MKTNEERPIRRIEEDWREREDRVDGRDWFRHLTTKFRWHCEESQAKAFSAADTQRIAVLDEL